MNLSCTQFSFLTNIYTLSYICANYDVYCDDYCITDTLNKCYCYCDSNKIYCYEHNYFLQRFFSVLFVGILFALCCYCFLICLCKPKRYSQLRDIQQKNETIPNIQELPKYEEIKK